MRDIVLITLLFIIYLFLIIVQVRQLYEHTLRYSYTVIDVYVSVSEIKTIGNMIKLIIVNDLQEHQIIKASLLDVDSNVRVCAEAPKINGNVFTLNELIQITYIDSYDGREYRCLYLFFHCKELEFNNKPFPSILYLNQRNVALRKEESSYSYRFHCGKFVGDSNCLYDNNFIGSQVPLFAQTACLDKDKIGLICYHHMYKAIKQFEKAYFKDANN